MTVYLERALNMLKRPAALYEWPSLRWLSWNQAGAEAGESITDHPEGPPRLSWGGIDEQHVVAYLRRNPDQHMMFETERRLIVLSLVEPLPTHVRPALVLVTAHDGQSEGLAELDHLRLRTMMLVTEGIEVAEENLQTGVQLVAASMESLSGLHKVFHEHAEAIMERVQKESMDKG